MRDRHTTASSTGRRRALGWAAVIAVVILLVAGAVIARSAIRSRHTVQRAERPETVMSGVRIRVQVLNATPIRGLARRATLHLRDRGFDVVEMGTARETLDSTLVLDRSGHPEWARGVADAMGGARVRAQPDTSRYVDVTVLVGRSWRPPAQPFYP